MDSIFVILALAILVMSGTLTSVWVTRTADARDVFLLLVAAEFVVAAVWVQLPVGDPWWFLSYAAQNCLFAWIVMLTGYKLAAEYAGTLIASALIATITFCEYYTGGSAVYGIRPTLMAWICVCQLWIAASGAGLVEGSPWRAARGIVARCAGRRRGAGADTAAGSVGREA